jgi:endonuclease/exonuclease/phosphatase family metal-dependent hydrolase
MTLFRKSALSIVFVAVTLMLSFTMTVKSAQGESTFRAVELLPETLIADTLSLLTLNVAHGRGTALNQLLVAPARHRQNLDQIAAIIAASGAQVVALQEADAPSLWSGQFDHVEFLADSANYGFYVHGHHAQAWPYTYGAALLSRSMMSDARSHRFRPSWPTAGKGFVRGTLHWRTPEDEERLVTLVSVHLDFSRESVREGQIAELVDDLRAVSTPLIILGDFNADWSIENSPVRVLARELGLRAYRPAAQELGTYKGTKRLDWILISQELSFVDYTVLPDVVSDHLAVLATIGWGEKEE